MTTSGSGADIARELVRRGLGAPALVLLEAHRPVRPLMALGATFLGPITRPLLGPAAGRLARTLESDAEYDALLATLRREARG